MLFNFLTVADGGGVVFFVFMTFADIGWLIVFKLMTLADGGGWRGNICTIV